MDETRVGVRDFYIDTVLPALAQRLDVAFPEFGWRRDGHGWVATNEETTHRVLGVRADRVVAHGCAPRGFLIHGADPVLWTEYVSGGNVPRGQEFVRAVKDIAARAGIDVAPIDRPTPHSRRASLFASFFGLCQRELLSQRGEEARRYLISRGFPGHAIETTGLGLVPQPTVTRKALIARGFAPEEITASGIVDDSRWPGRVLGAWPDESGRIRTFWARARGESSPGASKYLYLRGAPRRDLPPYGLASIINGPSDRRRDVVLVEGVFDVHLLRARGFEDVASIGGTGAGKELFERLDQFGVEAVTLCFDNDEPGRRALARAVEQAVRAKRSPAVHLVDPGHLDPEKDPDAFVRARGVYAWRDLIRKRECGISWRAIDLAGELAASRPGRRQALARAGEWLGTLPARLALEQDDAVRLLAERAGYDPVVVARAFRARFWRDVQDKQLRRVSAIGLER